MKFTKEKRELLVTKLLTSKTEASNIPPNILTITIRYIDFPPIIIEDIRKVVIETKNIVPGIDKVLTTILQVVWP